MITEATAVRGTISSVAFTSGDRFVVGHWAASPLGRLVDVMWVRADGYRLLLTTDDAAAAFIGSIYRFDEVRTGPLSVEGGARSTACEGFGLRLDMRGGRRRRVPFPRPRWVTRRIEAPIARALMGVETYGASPTGVREWYQTRGWCWLEHAHASLEGRDLGAMTPIRTPLGVGFSDPPARPSIVEVHVAIQPAET